MVYFHRCVVSLEKTGHVCFLLVKFSPWLTGSSREHGDDSVVVLFQSFLREAIISSSGMGRDVHSLALSIQHFLCRPRRRPPSKVPWRLVLERLSWRVTCSLSFSPLTVARRGSCEPARRLILLSTHSLVRLHLSLSYPYCVCTAVLNRKRGRSSKWFTSTTWSGGTWPLSCLRSPWRSLWPLCANMWDQTSRNPCLFIAGTTLCCRQFAGAQKRHDCPITLKRRRRADLVGVERGDPLIEVKVKTTLRMVDSSTI